MLLCHSYATSGTDAVDGATSQAMGRIGARAPVRTVYLYQKSGLNSQCSIRVAPFALAMRCPAEARMAYPEVASSLSPGAISAILLCYPCSISLCAPYAISGTEIDYAATSCSEFRSLSPSICTTAGISPTLPRKIVP
eukprot:790515-Rhodomonas_salina.1